MHTRFKTTLQISLSVRTERQLQNFKMTMPIFKILTQSCLLNPVHVQFRLNILSSTIVKLEDLLDCRKIWRRKKLSWTRLPKSNAVFVSSHCPPPLPPVCFPTYSFLCKRKKLVTDFNVLSIAENQLRTKRKRQRFLLNRQ